MTSAAEDNTDLLVKLLPFGDANAVNEDDGATPLIKACSNGVEAVKMLLDAGATESINVQDFYGRTALFHACAAESTSSHRIVELLINRGADVSLAVPATAKKSRQFNPGWTPLFAALPGGVGCHRQKLEVLLNAGADIFARTFITTQIEQSKSY
jgi:ankyrin repeat protein